MQTGIWAWDSTNSKWIKVEVDTSGRLVMSIVLARLDDIEDVDVASPTDLYIVYWNDTNSKWECRAFTDWLHASAHENGGGDEISIAGLAGESAVMTTHKADLDAHIANPLELFRTGEYFFPHVFSTNETPITADIIRSCILNVPRDITIDRIAIQVTGAVDPSVARIAIYNNGTNLYPGSLLLQAGEVNTSTTGIKAITINQALTKGVYWLVVVSDENISLFVQDRYYGTTTPLGIVSTSFNTWQGGWWKAFTYAALPDPFPAGGAIDDNRCPVIPIRIASLD